MATHKSIAVFMLLMITVAYTIDLCAAASKECLQSCMPTCMKVKSATRRKCEHPCKQVCDQIERSKRGRDDWTDRPKRLYS